MFAPMLAERKNPRLDRIRYPKLVAKKIDGFRCLTRSGGPMSRTLKRFPNRHINEIMAGLPDGLDGELTIGVPYGHDTMQRAQSGIMSEDGTPDFTYWVFDHLGPDPAEPFQTRLARAHDLIAGLGSWIQPVGHELVFTQDDVLLHEEKALADGFEGIMLRCPNGPYKFGRATMKEESLLKYKRFEDAEFEIVGYAERMHNANEATRNELGRTQRSSAQAGLVGTGTLGALLCRLPEGGTVSVGTGLTRSIADQLWVRRETLAGELAKIRFWGRTPDGSLRFPRFVSIRPRLDL